MNPNPDPLMGAAMGAPPPMMGQDPMMGQMQDPMMQPPMQDPMMGPDASRYCDGPADASRPNDATANARSYDARSHDAARDNGCGWRHDALQDVWRSGNFCWPLQHLGAQEPGEFMRQILSLGLSEAEVAEIIKQSTDPLALLSQQNQELNFCKPARLLHSCFGARSVWCYRQRRKKVWC